MDIDLLSVYLPVDRRHALATHRPLPDRAEGAALFADITGFTPLTDALATLFGPQRGAEETTRLLNRIYDALIAQVHRYGGSVVGFSGDGFTCWFSGPSPADSRQDALRGTLRAVACGLALQQTLTPFADLSMLDDSSTWLKTSATPPISMRVAVVAGPVRRFVVGDPCVQRLDLLAGATLDRLAKAEQTARQGEVVVGQEVAHCLGSRLTVTEWRKGLAVVNKLTADVPPTPWPTLPADALTDEQVRPYLLPPVYERLLAGRGEFLAELRPAVSLFLCFGGLDYDHADAGPRLDAYVCWVQDVLEHYDCYLLQLTTGDKGSYLYASFGAPAAHEDDAERALAAALELQHPPSNLDFITGVRIGVSQGWVRAGAYGSQTRRTYGAMGDEVNVAARLMRVAPAGEIRCSQRIHQAANGCWAFEPLPSVRVKGKAAPLPVYRPLRRRREHPRRAERPLIGRHAEMETLTRLLAEARAGRRRILLLEGEAGIGKSRLVAELARLARERDAAWLLGAGQSIDQRTPYRAWRDLLTTYFGLDDHMNLAEQQHRVQEQILEAYPALAERIPLLNDVLRLDLPETDLTRGFTPKLRHESLTALIIDLLRAATLRQVRHGLGPLVLVLEDCHWLDSLSWELTLAVARALSDRPLLLVLALRPFQPPTPNLQLPVLTGLEGTETLHLDSLPPQETVALAAACLGLTPDALPTEVTDLVRERAGGNPFFAEELAYAMRESGMVTSIPSALDGTSASGEALTALRESVPDTVEGVVLSRIDRLPSEEQLILKVASVIGRSFPYHILRRILRDVYPRQLTEDLLRAHLDDLSLHGLLLLEEIEPEPTYLFKHVITQQVTYDTLLFAQRQPLHRAVASWYEQAYADNLPPHYPSLVHHWHRAEETEQERHYCRLAGGQAAAQFANAEAVAYLSRALDLTPQTDYVDRYDLLMAREKVHNLQGTRELQEQDQKALEALTEALGDLSPGSGQADRQQAEVALRRARCAESTGDYPAAIAAARAVIDLTDHRPAAGGQQISPETARLQALGYLQWSRALWRSGDFVAAHSRIERSLALARAAQLHQVEADGLRILGGIRLYTGNYVGSSACYEQALHIHRKIGDLYGEGASLNNLGITFNRQGKCTAAKAHYEQSLHIFCKIGSREGESLLYNNLGMVYRDHGDYARARASLNQALRIHREIGDRRGEDQAINTLGLVLADLGDYASARAYHIQSLCITRELGDRMGESITLSYLGALSARQGESEAAQDYSQQALLVAKEIGVRRRQGFALISLGHALMGLGKLAEASDTYRQALTLRRGLGEPHLAIETLAGLARVALAQGDIAQAQAQVEEILEYLETQTPAAGPGHNLDGTEEPFRIYLTCYRVLHANQDPRALVILSTAYNLLQEHAANIDSQELLHSFLEDVIVNREIIAAYQAMQAGSEMER